MYLRVVGVPPWMLHLGWSTWKGPPLSRYVIASCQMIPPCIRLRKEATEEQNMKAEHHDPECVPMAKWQTQSFPNCNIIHEMDLREAADEEGKSHQRYNFLGQAGFDRLGSGTLTVTHLLY
ncbi:hypothetical protein MHU86_19864 [Fragilaria crotonensis]|nr:hypothetical protein MHU86_19864 [Fragilaria crotonensis]